MLLNLPGENDVANRFRPDVPPVRPRRIAAEALEQRGVEGRHVHDEDAEQREAADGIEHLDALTQGHWTRWSGRGLGRCGFGVHGRVHYTSNPHLMGPSMHSLSRSAIVLTFLALFSGATLAAESTPTPTQLPRLVRPTQYNVTIEPDPAALTFRGDVAIALDVLAPVQSITLNALDMKFRSVRFTTSTGGAAVTTEPKITIDEAAQTATFDFGKKIPSGSYWLALDYTGKIGTQAVGLFAIDYDTANGKSARCTRSSKRRTRAA